MHLIFSLNVNFIVKLERNYIKKTYQLLMQTTNGKIKNSYIYCNGL